MHAPSSNRYTVVAILLHWAIAALILFMIWLGWNMEDNEARFQLHKSIGIAILFLSVARVLWRWRNPPPPLPDDMTPWEKRLSHGVHIGFYALMIGLPLLGWLLVSTSKFQVSTVLFGTVSWPHLPFTEGLRGGVVHDIVEFLHSKGAWVLIVLLGLHVAGAVKHEIAAEQGVFKRMIPGLFGRPHSPPPPRGYAIAFGGAALLFAIIAAVPLMKSAPPAPAGPASTGTVPADAGNWEIDGETSEIAFAGTYQNKPFSGTFTRWNANVLFDPEDLEGSAVTVEVQPGSAQTGTKLYDDTLQSGEWFDTGTYPVVKVSLINFAAAPDGGYTAEASLLVKEQAVNVPFDFSLMIEGDTATFEGTTTLSRAGLNLGQQSDPGGDWVSDDVTVTVKGTATRRE
ncbi:cytochrome b/b6 domain-containing protein [Hyphomonas adhaerens]|uniref:cytochrome b/b6 domain-containing protein n=1 Tax=Hyphomonas adhaerens TaxID=81029 RepID=UPI002357AF5F|nr:cytochrome b/b6 domain-containing protein [Hyphomonas adhaerens]